MEVVARCAASGATCRMAGPACSQSALVSSFQGLRVRPAAVTGLAARRPALSTNRQQRPAQIVAMSAVSEPATLTVRSFEGAEAGSETLALKVADPATAKGLVHRYLVMVRQNARQGTASTKTRAEVRGGGKKPYAQKGSGGARRGSRRSPLLPGGGVVFGPKPKDWSIRMNKKERRLALATALQSAAGSTIVIEDLKGEFPAPKTSKLVSGLAAVGASPERHTLLITAELDDNIYRSARNVEKVAVNVVDKLRVYDVLRADTIVVEKSALKFIQEFYA